MAVLFCTGHQVLVKPCWARQLQACPRFNLWQCQVPSCFQSGSVNLNVLSENCSKLLKKQPRLSSFSMNSMLLDAKETAEKAPPIQTRLSLSCCPSWMGSETTKTSTSWLLRTKLNWLIVPFCALAALNVPSMWGPFQRTHSSVSLRTK